MFPITERFTTFTMRISRLHRLIQKLKTDGMGRFGLKGVDTLCLYQLALHSPMTFSEIAEHCDLDPALVSRTLRGLTKGGMVVKDGEPGKYRASYALTEEGQALTKKIAAIIQTIQTRADNGIEHADLITFYRVLDQITANLEQMAADTATTFSNIETSQQEEL